MTEQQAIEIEKSGNQWIAFYYGRVSCGYLTRDRLARTGKWYFTEKWEQFDREMNKSDWLNDPNNAEPIQLSMIEITNGPLPHMDLTESAVYSHEFDETILIVIGAGASFDFTGESGIRFPLTNQLFDDRFKDVRSLYPGVEKQFHSLTEVADLENYFERKWKIVTSSYNPDLLNNLVSIQFYLQQLFLRLSLFHYKDSPNRYNALIQQMRDYGAMRANRVRFVVVNFNYDILFEKALEKEMNYNFNSISDYDECSRLISVLKPHGSSNWVRYGLTDLHKLPKTSAEYSSKLAQIPTNQNYSLYHIYASTSPNISVIQNTHVFENLKFDPSIPITEKVRRPKVGLVKSELRENRRFFAHLLLPYSKKDLFMIPQTQISRLQLMLEKCSRVYCIGWKGNERNFIDLLANKEFQITWITGKNGQAEILQGEAQRLTKSKHTYYNQGFSECMKYVNNSMENMFDGKLGIGVNHG